MNFTYIQGTGGHLNIRFCHRAPKGPALMPWNLPAAEEVIVMTTRRDTKKFELLRESNQVALLGRWIIE
jgi:hypothetical protein